MASIATNCKEESNSTDCLLRALIAFLEESQNQDDAEYNWDPITFAFTVAISLCAVMFALVTIFQAVLAAGPGRRRSDHRAIGRWSAKTEWKWSLWDFSFIHIARTPILRLSKLEDLLEPATLGEGKTGESECPSPPKTQTAIDDRPGSLARIFKDGWGKLGTMWAAIPSLLHQGRPSNRNSEAAIASWVQFLQKTGLPGDMRAAPAYADIGFIVTVMSADGAQMRMSPDTGYPTMRGRGCQFEILQHATLGTIGSFSSYEVEGGGDASHQPPSPDALRVAAKYACGLFDIMPRFPVGDLNLVERQGDLDEELKSKLSARPGDNYEITREDYFSAHQEFCDRCRADTPKLAPTLFPWGNVDFSGPLIALTLASVFWTNLDRSQLEHLPGLIFNDKYRDCGVRPAPWASDTAYNCPCVETRSACAEMLRGSDSFKRWRAFVNSMQLLRLRNHMTIRVEEIDDWLQRREEGSGEFRTCRRFKLLGDAVALVDMIKSLNSKADEFWDTPDQYGESSRTIRDFFAKYSQEKLTGMDETAFKADDTLRPFRTLLPTLSHPTGSLSSSALARCLL